MSKKPRRPPSLNAIKHGAYSNLGLLPGEDLDEYNEHHRQIRLEWQPAGLSGETIVTHMGNLLWREQNLPVYQLYARIAKKWHPVLAGANEPDFSLDDALLRFAKQNLFQLLAHLELANDRADAKQKLDQGVAEFNSLAKEVLQKEGVDTDEILTQAMAELLLALASEGFTAEQLMRDIEVRDRLHASYARSLKLLFETKGWKAVAGLNVPPDPQRQVTGPINVIEQTKPGEEVSAGAPASGTGNQSEEVEPTVAPAEASALPTIDAPTLIPASEAAVPVPAHTEPQGMPIMSDEVPEPAAKADCAGTTIKDGAVVAGADQAAGPPLASA
jgi:hypothetical protein